LTIGSNQQRHILFALVLALALLLVLTAPGLLPQQTPDVQAANDTIHVTTTGTGDGSSWANAANLQDALTTGGAVDAEATDEIWVAAGIYYPVIPADPDNVTQSERRESFFLVDGVKIYGGFEGNETQLGERNPDPATNGTILSGAIGTADISDNSHTVVRGDGVSASAVLDGFTITAADGTGTTPGTAFYRGGGFYSSGGSPTLRNLIISDNLAGQGGGMFIENGTPILNDVTFSGNTANLGGGMVSYTDSNPVLTRVTFSENATTSLGNGGGMYIWDSNPVLNDVTFSGNTANLGGGIHTRQNSNPVLNGVTFSSNTATNQGGGISNSINSGNKLTLNNVTISGNTATNQGGGIHNNYGLTLRNSTISDNTVSGGASPQGSGLYASSSAILTMTNSIIADNTGPQECTFLNNAAVIEVNTNNWFGDDSCDGTADGSALLAPLSNNGGETLTMMPLEESPVVDAGDNATCLAEDQRGISRPQRAVCDIGALEEIPLDLQISKAATPDSIARAGELLTYTVTISNSGAALNPGEPHNDQVVAIDTLPAGVEVGTLVLPAGWDATINNNTITFDMTGALAADTVSVFTIPVTPTGQFSPLDNTAQVQLTSSLFMTDTNSTNNLASVSTDVVIPVNVILRKTSNITGEVSRGDNIAYTINVTNTGSFAAPNASVLDTIPDALENASWTCTAGSGASCGTDSGTGNISHTVSLDPGASAAFVINATIRSGAMEGTLVNEAEVIVPAGYVNDAGSDARDSSPALTIPPFANNLYLPLIIKQAP
jgi:uncharacterized repeat protein (TIGR01451 family)